MKALLIGSGGQLGTDILKILSQDTFFQIIPLEYPEVDIALPRTLEQAVVKHQPQMIISTAGYSRVDDAEENPEAAFAVNAFGARNLAMISRKYNLALTHFSTDFVFGEDVRRIKPYRETDSAGPINAYGVSKLAGEYFIRYLMRKYFLIRPCGLFGTAGPKGKTGNFVDLIIRQIKENKEIKVVSDQILTPTYTVDLAKNLQILLKTGNYGLYHITSEGQCSWYEFASEIIKLTGHTIKLIAQTSEQLNQTAKRPKFSVLENYNLKKLGLNQTRRWQEALKAYMVEKGYI